MGITILYSGRAKSWDALTRLLTTAQVFAAEREWQFALYDDPLGIMDGRDKDNPGYIEHDGPFRGIVMRPHPKCEHVRLNFSIANELAGFTKTQFAPFEVHVEVVKLLRGIEAYMEDFVVVDESGLWETGDEAAARARFEALGDAIDLLADGLGAEGMEVEGPGVPGDAGEEDPPPGVQPYG